MTASSRLAANLQQNLQQTCSRPQQKNMKHKNVPLVAEKQLTQKNKTKITSQTTTEHEHRNKENLSHIFKLAKFSIRGIDIDSIMCAICDNGVEMSRHLLFYCCMVRQIVRKITRWWDVPYVEVESYKDWYNWLVNLRISSMHKQMFEGIDVTRRLV
ncbi:hypothetical protein Tco_0074015, partial [Tanacetum coccineum]